MSRHRPNQVPTLFQLQRQQGWMWVICDSCVHRTAIALAPLIIRWGLDASSDLLRHNARCTACGRKGATIQVPGWVDQWTGREPFPVERMCAWPS